MAISKFKPTLRREEITVKKDGEIVTLIVAGRPCCPICSSPLEGVPDPVPSSGKGLCPEAGGYYSWKLDTDHTHETKDKFGNITKKKGWLIEPEGEDKHK